MKLAAAALLIMLSMAGPSPAGPTVDIVTVLEEPEPGDMVRHDPAAGETLKLHLVFSDFDPGSGLSGCAFRLDRTFGGTLLSMTNLLPGLVIGDPETGCMLSAFECVYPDTSGRVLAAELLYVCSGEPGTIGVAPHPVEGGVLTDCDVALVEWEGGGRLGIGRDVEGGSSEQAPGE